MKNLLAILPSLRAQGWEIDAWCIRSEIPPEICRHTYFPALKRWPTIEVLVFTVLANLRALWCTIARRHDAMLVTHSTGNYHLGADVVSYHFINSLWVQLQLRIGLRGFKEIAGFVVSCWGALLDFSMFRWPKRRVYLPVSDCLADEVRKRQRSDCTTITVPSVYDPERFNPQVRVTHRNSSRAELGYAPGDIVLAFTSQGSYRRKGLFLGLEALQVVRRSHPNVRLLIIGGSPKVTSTLKGQLDSVAPDWRTWVNVAGHVPDIARALCAADAFFFPSYFESFASVELEAAALGLPLLLTKHFGTEMTLRPGVNGELLSFEPKEMAAQIKLAISRLSAYDSSGQNRGLTLSQFSDKIISIYEKAVLSKSATAT